MPGDKRPRVVIDTNVLISAAIKPGSTPAKALLKAKRQCLVCVSAETKKELEAVIFRPKFDLFFTSAEDERVSFIDAFLDATLGVDVTMVVTDCRDPKDNMFLALALSAKAHFLVSGDRRDLLAMSPYQGIAIVNAAQFLALNL